MSLIFQPINLAGALNACESKPEQLVSKLVDFNTIEQAHDRTPAPDLLESLFPATLANDWFGSASLGVATLHEPLDVVDGTYMEVMELPSMHRVYQHDVENCRCLGTQPMPLGRALAIRLDAIAEEVARR